MIEINSPCLLCREPVGPDDEQAEGVWRDQHSRQYLVHRECALRNVIGGIGHLLDHYLWCTISKDPDGGRTYRQSAIEVDQWVRQHGVPG
jgi:hypothetical protein